MNKTITLCFIFIFSGLVSCKDKKPQDKESTLAKPELSEVIKEDYELYKPTQKIQAVLILFGGYPEVAQDIKREFKILELAKANGIAVIFSNYNQKLWLEQNEKHQLATRLQEIIKNNQLPNDNIFIGGFSSGGVVSLLMSDFIVEMKQFHIDPKGVFIVDSPIDLAELYASSEKNIERDFSEASTQESTWVLETLGNAFGNPKEEIGNYENKSVFTYRSNHTSNLERLKNTKIRLYTEPDTLWWKKHRMADYDQTNAYFIKALSENLKEKGFEKVEYISTIDRGYRANGEKHPHSWSIVDKPDLINWILKE